MGSDKPEVREGQSVKVFCAASFILGASLTLVGVTAVTGLLVRHYHGLARALRQPLASQDASAVGAGGKIEAIEIPLANTDGAFPDKTERLAQPQWFFEGVSEPRLTRFFSSCELRPVEKNVLLDKRSWEIRTNGIMISPPEQLVWSLSHRARQQIYSVLAKSPANYPQCFPFRFPVNAFDLKFKNSGLPVAQVERIRRLTYTSGSYVCFTDLRALEPVLKPVQFKDLIEILYAVPTYLLRLSVTADSDIDALTKYWGRGGREKLIAPLLTSLARTPGGGSINISSLLPPFARLHLYTYPDAWKDPTATRQDCFFTAMNFFNDSPNTNFFDATYSRKILDTDYEQVNGEPGFGDLVALFNQKGDAVHTCVYLVDDFVFTKNGVNPEQPWVLMQMADMVVIYFPEKKGKLLVMRHRGAS